MRTLSAVAVLWAGLAVMASGQSPVVPYEIPPGSVRQSTIDRAVFAKLRQEKIQPANVCSDPVFLRRVYLDVIGTLPTAEEAEQFLLSRNERKRQLLIDALLERDEFSDYWALKWGDLLRIKAEFPVNLWPNAVQAYHRWVKTCLKEDVPYDRFVREIITASGSNFRVPQVNFYRSTQSKDPEELARAVALTFMGARAEAWPEERLKNMAVFFSRIGYKRTAEWKEEIVYFDRDKGFAEGEAPATVTAVLPDGTKVELTPDVDPRVVFADWLITPKNPWFARNYVNRVWSWLMGHGVIHEPDDIRDDNPPTNPKLLDILERELLSSHYETKSLLRKILGSRAYQQSSISASDDPQAAELFAYYQPRRLEAEVLIDAIGQITGTSEEYSSPIPEPFTFIPEHRRSIALSDGSITSPFLDMFGRPPRDTGLESERNNRASAGQRLHFLNSSHIQQKIERGEKLKALLSSRGKPEETVVRLYLTILSRFPSDLEIRNALEYSKLDSVQGNQALVDLAWALFNSVEFMYRH